MGTAGKMEQPAGKEVAAEQAVKVEEPVEQAGKMEQPAGQEVAAGQAVMMEHPAEQAVQAEEPVVQAVRAAEAEEPAVMEAEAEGAFAGAGILAPGCELHSCRSTPKAKHIRAVGVGLRACLTAQ